MRNGQGFAVKKDYSTKTNVTRVIDGGEPIEFRSLFKNWKVVDETTSVKVQVPSNRVAKVEHKDFDVNLLHEKPHIAADSGMVDDGSGKKEIFRVIDFDLVAVPAADYGKFYAGDCYVINYAYTVGGTERNIIYYWLDLKKSSSGPCWEAKKTISLIDALPKNTAVTSPVSSIAPMPRAISK